MSQTSIERPTLIAYQNQPPARLVSDYGIETQQQDMREIWVQRFDSRASEEMIAEAAVGVQGVLLAAYSRRFEGYEPSKIQPGTFERYRFDPTDETKVQEQITKMTSALTKGSQYFVASTNDPRGIEAPQVVGVAKVTSSMSRVKRTLSRAPLLPTVLDTLGMPLKPNMFVNDVATAEDRMGIGSILLGAAIDYAGYESSARMALHAFTAEPATNQWYLGLGMHSVRQLSEVFVVGPRSLEQELMASGANSLADIRAILANKHPDIDTGKPV